MYVCIIHMYIHISIYIHTHICRYGLCAVTPEKIPEKWSITLFSEELVRGGGCSFVLSSFLRKLDKAIRAEGGGAQWQIISQGDPGAKGWMVEVNDLMSVQVISIDR